MEAEFVYRVQDRFGRGPWRPGFSHKWVEDREDFATLLPTHIEFPGTISKILYGEHCGAGCRTIGQLRRWFTKNEYKKLKSFGYRAVKMKVGRIIAESDIQCLFGRAKPLSDDVKEIKLW